MFIDLKDSIADLYRSFERLRGALSSVAMQVKALMGQFGEVDNASRVHEERIDALEQKATKQAAEIKDLRQHVAELQRSASRQGMH